MNIQNQCHGVNTIENTITCYKARRRKANPQFSMLSQTCMTLFHLRNTKEDI